MRALCRLIDDGPQLRLERVDVDFHRPCGKPADQQLNSNRQPFTVTRVGLVDQAPIGERCNMLRPQRNGYEANTKTFPLAAAAASFCVGRIGCHCIAR